jgi:hypothetical protein
MERRNSRYMGAPHGLIQVSHHTLQQGPGFLRLAEAPQDLGNVRGKRERRNMRGPNRRS